MLSSVHSSPMTRGKHAILYVSFQLGYVPINVTHYNASLDLTKLRSEVIIMLVCVNVCVCVYVCGRVCACVRANLPFEQLSLLQNTARVSQHLTE